MSSILTLFESIVSANPDKTAIELRDQSLSFQELALRSKQIGIIIQNTGLVNKPIGVFADREIEPLVGFIGVLYSKNFYVPIDVEMPAEKIKYIIENAGISVMLCNRKYDDILKKIDYKGKTIHYDGLSSDEYNVSADFEADLLYMVYTSGSTGKPKGVLKTQSAEINFIDIYWKRMKFNKEDVIGNQTPFFFDAASKDIYLMLCKGITMVIIPTELFALPPELIDYLNKKKITVASWVPTVISLIAMLNPFSMYKPTTLRMILLVGEVMPMKHLNVWRKALPDIKYVNLYGQTEIAGICSYYEVKDEFKNTDTLPIGKALDNCKIYLIDNESIVTEQNHVGELYIVSQALAQCYWNDEEKTNQNFLYRDFGNGPVRCFKTGDMAQYDSDGNLVFASRRDNQIKHMGHRIELGEIETAADSLPYIARCCCVYDEDKRKIALFCQLTPESTKTGKEIRSDLKRLLSSYMLPGKIIIKETLPLNRNGKIDRQELKTEM